MKTTKSSMLPATIRTVGMMLIAIMVTIVAHSQIPEMTMHAIVIIGIVALAAFIWAEVITTVSSIQGSFKSASHAVERLKKEVKDVRLDT